MENTKIVIDSSIKYQIIESFGASGSWWSQDVGGWNAMNEYGITARNAIATLLYDADYGIGLTNYRYNIGAGSADSLNSDISDPWRRAQSFETAPNRYDWSKDENAVWFMNKAVELGVNEVILFVNSPLERLTVTGKANANGKEQSNLPPKNYEEFAIYVMDVAEHFVSKGVPVKFISPINEPQWDWNGGQEGCHYEPNEVVEVLKACLIELKKRELLHGVELSAPEGGDWGELNKKYVSSILKEEELAEHFKYIDNHSYWSNKDTKIEFKNWIDTFYPNIKLRTSEWCEMVSGKDTSIESAINLAREIHDDLSILDVTSWQLWIAVSCYDYRDGLIYVDKELKTYNETKRLWGFGNYSKFVRPGYQRMKTMCDVEWLKTTAYIGKNDRRQEEIVVVAINESIDAQIQLVLDNASEYRSVKVFTTSGDISLECSFSGEYNGDTVFHMVGQSISTIVLSK